MSAHPDLDVRLAAARAHGFLGALLEMDELPGLLGCHAKGILSDLNAALFPASDACPLGVTGKPVPAIDAGRDKGGEE